MTTYSSRDPRAARRDAHERARHQNQIRVASVLGAHGALFTSLRTGFLRQDDQLDEARLGPMFSVSRNAIRGALRLLAAEGVVSREPRNGTVVISAAEDVPLGTGLGWNESSYAGREVVVTEQRWIPSTPMTRYYLRTGSEWVHATELSDSYDGRPDLLYTRFTLTEGAWRPTVTGPQDGDFASLFRRTYGSPLAAVDCWVEATGADDRSAARLRVPAGTPLIVKSRVLYSADGVPREYSISHYPAAHVVLSADVDSIDEPRPAGMPGTAGPALVPGAPRSGVLRRRSSIDLHTELRAAIREGLFAVGDRLDEEELADIFGTTRNTVRRVLAQLVAAGLVHRSRRGGTVVTSAVADYTLNAGMPYRPDERHRYRDECLASATIPTPPFVAGLLQTDSPLVALDEFLLYRDDRLMTAYLRYVEPSAAPRPLTSSRREDFQTLFTRAYGEPAGSLKHSLHAVRADERVARRLGLPPGTILLLSERVIHDVHGRPRELSHSYHLATHVSLACHHELPAA
jgi:GntR family transcriptional regulator